jgi:hypothetical protein
LAATSPIAMWKRRISEAINPQQDNAESDDATA